MSKFVSWHADFPPYWCKSVAANEKKLCEKNNLCDIWAKLLNFLNCDSRLAIHPRFPSPPPISGTDGYCEVVTACLAFLTSCCTRERDERVALPIRQSIVHRAGLLQLRHFQPASNFGHRRVGKFEIPSLANDFRRN